MNDQVSLTAGPCEARVKEDLIAAGTLVVTPDRVMVGSHALCNIEEVDTAAAPKISKKNPCNVLITIRKVGTARADDRVVRLEFENPTDALRAVWYLPRGFALGDIPVRDLISTACGGTVAIPHGTSRNVVVTWADGDRYHQFEMDVGKRISDVLTGTDQFGGVHVVRHDGVVRTWVPDLKTPVAHHDLGMSTASAVDVGHIGNVVACDAREVYKLMDNRMHRVALSRNLHDASCNNNKPASEFVGQDGLAAAGSSTDLVVSIIVDRKDVRGNGILVFDGALVEKTFVPLPFVHPDELRASRIAVDARGTTIVVSSIRRVTVVDLARPKARAFQCWTDGWSSGFIVSATPIHAERTGQKGVAASWSTGAYAVWYLDHVSDDDVVPICEAESCDDISVVLLRPNRANQAQVMAVLDGPDGMQSLAMEFDGCRLHD